jgi:hypothetical protein
MININGYLGMMKKTIRKYEIESVGKHFQYPKMEKYIKKDKCVLENKN